MSKRMRSILTVKVLALKNGSPMSVAWTDEQIQDKIDFFLQKEPKLTQEDFEVVELMLPNIYSTVVGMLMKHGITTGSPSQVWGNRALSPDSPEELVLQAILSDQTDILAEMFAIVDQEPEKLEHLGFPLWKWEQQIVPDHAEQLIESFEEIENDGGN